MGKEFVIDNLEDMCALMCDNIIPERKRGKNENTLGKNNNRHRTVQGNGDKCDARGK